MADSITSSDVVKSEGGYGWYNYDIATNGGIRTWGGCMNMSGGIRVSIKRKIKKSGTLVARDQMRFLRLNLGGW